MTGENAIRENSAVSVVSTRPAEDRVERDESLLIAAGRVVK